MKLENGVEAWSFSSTQCVKTAVENAKETLHGMGRKLPHKANTPLASNCRPELDVTAELNANDTSLCQSWIGMLRWIVELGRVDICLEVSMMSSHLALPRQGHLDQVAHIFGYLNNHANTALVFDPTEPDINEADFAKARLGIK